MPPFRTRDYIAPRFWPTWIGLALLRAAANLSYRRQVAMGAALGRLLYYALPGRRRTARINVEIAFPELTPAERTDLVRRHFRSAGITVFETAMSWWGKEDALRPLAHVHGLEYLEAALAKGRGVILLSGHFTSFEIGGRLLSMRQPLQFMYKVQFKNPLYEAVTQRIRRRHYAGALRHDDVRGMVRALKANRVCWYLPDQDLGRKHSVFARFMGTAAATAVAPARFARMTGAAVVPYYPLRREDDSGYDLVILPEWEDYPSGDDEQDARRFNEFIADQARRAPEQYLWLHRRFKTRPPGEAPLYPKRKRKKKRRKNAAGHSG